jgi:phenylacetate-CoA ligase
MKVDPQIASEGATYSDCSSENGELARVVNHARNRSPFYADHWRGVAETGWSLSDFPLVDLQKYWAGNRELDSWDVLTGKVEDGIVFKTGGTTGMEKISIYTRSEWEKLTSIFGRNLAEKLRTGDRVANLFMAGDLYASFMFVSGSLMESSRSVLQFPFTGSVDNAKLIDHIGHFNINVLIMVPARLWQLCAYLVEQDLTLPQIRDVFYGGECIFPEQRVMLERGFPNAKCSSVGCVSVDASLIGASSPDCQGNEHRCFDGDTITEIVDEVGEQPITEPGRVGKLVVTNLHRKLMPIIRYPTGDLAKWVDPVGHPMRKFLLCGRSGTNYRLRVGNVALFPNRLNDAICELIGGCSWQMIVQHIGLLDVVTVRIAADFDPLVVERLYSGIMKHDDRIPGQISLGLFELRIESCNFSDLVMHPRSGKLMQIVDQRTY